MAASPEIGSLSDTPKIEDKLPSNLVQDSTAADHDRNSVDADP